MTAPILVTGGTGTLGRLVTARLREAGRRVRVLSRHAHAPDGDVGYVVGDLTTGAGVAAALDGVGTVVHCAGSARGDDDKARTLVRAAGTAGVEHLVNISVVGADRVPVTSAVDRAMFGYFAGKRGAEVVIERSGVPWTNLRASQFHDLILTVLRALTKSPVVPVPPIRTQPVDADEVAARLVELALGEPAGLVPELAGPREYRMDELARSYLRATGKRRWLVPMPMAGGAARAVRAGALLPRDGTLGRRTWEEFLTTRLSTAD